MRIRPKTSVKIYLSKDKLVFTMTQRIPGLVSGTILHIYIYINEPRSPVA